MKKKDRISLRGGRASSVQRQRECSYACCGACVLTDAHTNKQHLECYVELLNYGVCVEVTLPCGLEGWAEFQL